MKHKVPTKEQADIIKTRGLLPFIWVVLLDSPKGLIIRHMISGEFKYLEK